MTKKKILINGLITMIPAGLIIGSLEYLGIRGMLIKVVVWGGLIMLVEKIQSIYRKEKTAKEKKVILKEEKQNKSNKELYVVVFIAIVFTTTFYWSLIRPSIIKSKCAKEADTLSKSEINDGIDYYQLLTGKNRTEEKLDRSYNSYYETCLRLSGM